RERPQRLARLLGGERGERGRVDAAAEKDADGDVAHEVGADGVAEPCTQLLDELRVVVASNLGGRSGSRPREPRHAHLAVLPDEDVPGGQLAALPEDRERRRDRVERKERLERVEIDLAARERTQLRRERKLVPVLPVDERLDPEAVAREQEPASAGVPERDREHPAEASRERLALLLVEVD